MIKRINLSMISKKSIILLLVLSLTLTIVLLVNSNVFAESYDEKNPELKLALINSKVEELYYSTAAYDCVGTLDQENGLYTMNTNAYVVWRDQDDVAFAYSKYDIGGKPTDVLTVETTVNERYDPNGGGLYSTASVGLMIRESTDPKSPQVFLHCREGNITIVYRSQYGGGTYVKYSGMEPVYPVSLKIEKKGTQYTCSYKNAGISSWKSFTPVGVNIQGPVLAGIGGHSSNGSNA